MKQQWLNWIAILLTMVPLVGQSQVNESGQQLKEGHETCTTATSVKENMPKPTPRDGICDKATERHVLPYDYVHERDVMWEKRLWREIHLNQKMNQHFANVQEPLVSILLQEADCGNIILYHPIDDKFTQPMTPDDISRLGGSYDTVQFYDPETYQDSFLVVYNEFNPEAVISYRIKEVWYFDSEVSEMRVRILGIAPIAERYDESGHLVATMPLFWVYYPDARAKLSNYAVHNPHNDRGDIRWDDIFEARYFSGLIVKESNVHDRRIEDYADGVNAVMEAERIQRSIQNYEADLWSR